MSRLNRKTKALPLQMKIIGRHSARSECADTMWCKSLRRTQPRHKPPDDGYRCIIDTIREGFWIVDCNGMILDVNDMFCRLTGYSRSELLTMSIRDLESVETASGTAWHFTRLIESGGENFESRYCCKDGSTVDLEISATYIPASSRIISFARNITWRKKFDKALQESHDRYIKLLYSVTDYIYTVTFRQGQAASTTHGSGCLAVTGYLPEDLENDPSLWINMVFEEDRELVRLQIEGIITGCESSAVEHRILHKDGAVRWVKNTPVPSYDQDGRLISYDGLITDITARKLAEEALKNSEKRLAELIDFLPDATIAIDLDGKVTLWNRAAEDFTGVKACDIIGKGDHEYAIPFYGIKRPILIDLVLTPSEEIEKHYPYVKREKGKVIGEGYTRSVKNGEAYMYGIAAPLYDAHGNLAGAIEAIRDITERKMLEDQLRQVQRLESLGQIAGGVAHDYNNALSAIIGFCSLAQMHTPKDGRAMNYLENILAVSERATNITKSLLAFSRKQVFDIKSIELNHTVSIMSKLLLNFIGEDVELRLDLLDRDLIIMGDPGHLDQVLMNLATNARDAMPKGGNLIISTGLAEMDMEFIRAHGYGKCGKYALLSVEDNGEGIDASIREHIFEPFFTTKEVGKGTGLGLSISYGIVKQHNGFIDVSSEPGKGTTFMVYLPLIEAKTPFIAAYDDIPVAGGNETLLLVEDDSSVRNALKTLLESHGYGVIEAENGHEAVEKFRADRIRIRLAVIDVVMHGKNGKEAYDEMRCIDAGIQAIFISGYASNVLTCKPILEEGLKFISKPVSPRLLLKTIRELLGTPCCPS
jgi:PAS domain S-box-containing protein